MPSTHDLNQIGDSGEKNEIERKFLLMRLPTNLAHQRSELIIQFYVKLGAWSSTVTRFRLQGNTFYEVVKDGQGLVRSEKTTLISEARYLAHWPLMIGQEVIKRRHYWPDGEMVLEIDVYYGQLKGLVVAEVEFPTIESAKISRPPLWLGREVTEDPAYSNFSLATKGLPPDFKRGGANAASV